jgi:pimeloyl-ACP methyl ester carboxylesterase
MPTRSIQWPSTSFLRLLPLALAAACATPIGVDPADPREVYREITSSAVSSFEPSSKSLELLTRLGLRDRFEEDPDSVLAGLHAGLGGDVDPDQLYALAELSFLRSEETGRSDQALAAAVYAYDFLFGRDPDEALQPFDPRVAVARNVYNIGLTRALMAADGTVSLESGVRPLPFGSLTISIDEGEKVWAGRTLISFRPVTTVKVRGLANRYRQSGIGAPLSATRGDVVGVQPPGASRVAARLQVPVTAVLRVPDVQKRLVDGSLEGTIEIFNEDERPDLEIAGQRIPLEREKSSSLAYQLEGAPIWDFGFAGFRMGDFMVQGATEQLLFLKPYRPGRIPLVLVHGTFSSPATWAQLVNELDNDPVVSRRYQIWLFIYNSGNPIAYSAGILRTSLENALRELDPDGHDPALRRMVVVGHSQGGLLTKATAVHTGDALWRQISDRPFDDVTFDPKLQELAQQSLFYEPLPFVERVIFMSTPHGGSYLSDLAPGAWVARLVKMPVTVTNLVAGLAAQSAEGDLRARLARPPTSLDNMRAGNPYLVTMHALPIDPRIHANSIIAVQGDGPLEEEGDGVVRYPSAHLEGVESELVVRGSDHSVQERPEGIREVRRILLEHLRLGE